MQRLFVIAALIAVSEYSEQKVFAVDNGTVIETGKIRYVGTSAGKPLDTTRRYTRTWVSRGSWQVVAEQY